MELRFELSNRKQVIGDVFERRFSSDPVRMYKGGIANDHTVSG